MMEIAEMPGEQGSQVRDAIMYGSNPSSYCTGYGSLAPNDTNGGYLDDLWRFDTGLARWAPVQAAGRTGTARKRASLRCSRRSPASSILITST